MLLAATYIYIYNYIYMHILLGYSPAAMPSCNKNPPIAILPQGRVHCLLSRPWLWTSVQWESWGPRRNVGLPDGSRTCWSSWGVQHTFTWQSERVKHWPFHRRWMCFWMFGSSFQTVLADPADMRSWITWFGAASHLAGPLGGAVDGSRFRCFLVDTIFVSWRWFREVSNSMDSTKSTRVAVRWQPQGWQMQYVQSFKQAGHGFSELAIFEALLDIFRKSLAHLRSNHIGIDRPCNGSIPQRQLTLLER